MYKYTGRPLVGLRNRVEAVAGTMTPDSPAGAGTVLTVLLRSPKKIFHPNGPWCIPTPGRSRA